jgi:hypothetical protein
MTVGEPHSSGDATPLFKRSDPIRGVDLTKPAQGVCVGKDLGWGLREEARPLRFRLTAAAPGAAPRAQPGISLIFVLLL